VDRVSGADIEAVSERGPQVTSMSDRLAGLGLEAGAVIEGVILSEPVRVVLAEEVGDRLRIGGQGLRTGRYHQLLLARDQLGEIRVAPAEGTFDGNPVRFKLGVEAQRLALAYEYDPYFSLSISRVDPLPHQVEAVISCCRFRVPGSCSPTPPARARRSWRGCCCAN